MTGIYLGIKSLTLQQQKDLALILKTGVRSDVFQKIEKTLIDCATIQQFDDSVFSQSQAEFKKSLKSLDKALDRAIRIATEDLSDTNIQLLDQSCWYANDHDRNFINPAKKPANSVVEERLSEIKNGVAFHLDNMTEPKRSRDRYSNAIRDFKDRFIKIFPNRQPSKEPESLFSQLVTFWLNELIGIEIDDPQRHIEKALTEKNTGK